MVQRWGKGKTYSGVLAQALLGEMSCQDEISPKRSNNELEPLGACHEGQRETTHTAAGKGAMANKQTNKQNSLLYLVMGSGAASTDEPMVVGKYTQTRQRQLKGKIVKFGHSRHYIRDPCRAQKGGRKRRKNHEQSNRNLQENHNKNKQNTEKEKRKEKKGRIRKKEQKDTLSPSKALLSIKDKGSSLDINHSGPCRQTN